MLLFLKRIETKGKWGFFIYALLTTIFVLFLIFFRYIYPTKGTYFSIVRLHNIIEFSLLAYIFSLYLSSALVKKISTYSIIPFIFLCIYDYIISKEPSVAYKALLAESLFFILLITYFFFEKMKQDLNESLLMTFIFWFAVAFLINFSGNFLLFVYSETSNKEPDFKSNYSIVYSSVTIIKNILLCIAVTMKEKNNEALNNNNLFPKVDPTIFNPVKTESH